MKRRNRYYKIGKQIKNPPKKQFIKETESIYEIPEKIIFSPTTCASSEENKKAENNGLLDKILNDDFLLIGLIAILLIERFNLKKSGADKNTLNEYDLMIAALIYIYF